MYGRRCLNMGRPVIQVSTLHEYKLEELIEKCYNDEKINITTTFMK